ncbi:RNA polymerase sigma factor [Arenimonas sp.]|uniref:RNA polymerase sigma factor n=1 Tax=Arenimonas sp. TaxID=1872635 RepID=UPI0039E557BA
MSEDEDIVAAVLARAPGAFERLVGRHQALVWHMVYRLVQHPEDAREVCQDVFFRVYDRLHQYRSESSLATWIGRVAYSVAVRHLQKKRIPTVSAEMDEDGEYSMFDHVSDGFDLESACADNELMGHLGEALETLPPLQRTLITLYHLDELGIGEIAAITELPEGTVKNYLFRARQKLRQQLERKLGVLA